MKKIKWYKLPRFWKLRTRIALWMLRLHKDTKGLWLPGSIKSVVGPDGDPALQIIGCWLIGIDKTVAGLWVHDDGAIDILGGFPE
jgi:hypothetical protein